LIILLCVKSKYSSYIKLFNPVKLEISLWLKSNLFNLIRSYNPIT